MAFLLNVKIRTRLLVLLAFTVASLWTLGGFSSLTIWRVSGQATGFIDREFAAVREVGGVHTAISDARRFEKDVMLNMGNDQATEQFTALWHQEIARIRQGLVTLGPLTQADKAPLLASVASGGPAAGAGHCAFGAGAPERATAGGQRLGCG